jgi:hypothetical protein
MENPGYNKPFYGRRACAEGLCCHRIAFRSSGQRDRVSGLKRPNNLVQKCRKLSVSPDEPTLCLKRETFKILVEQRGKSADLFPRTRFQLKKTQNFLLHLNPAQIFHIT